MIREVISFACSKFLQTSNSCENGMITEKVLVK